jgi:tetraacyldisaccharide 4'-kinase
LLLSIRLKPFIKYLLLPFTLLYWGITTIRNYLYDKAIFHVFYPNKPSICVGNLSVGGTGKTPMVKYLIGLLQAQYTTAVLSRGYGRKTKGFYIANDKSAAAEVGDEALEYVAMPEKAIVAVCESRANGYIQLISKKVFNTLLLDDAFQHRSIHAGLSMVLTAYDHLYIDDWHLPSGRLRESKFGIKRADIVVVTKCPNDIDGQKEEAIAQRLNLDGSQSLFFTKLQYESLWSPITNQTIDTSDLSSRTICLLHAIANAAPIEQYLKTICKQLGVQSYADHYHYTENDVSKWLKHYQNKEADIYVITSKDWTKLKIFQSIFQKNEFPLYILPVKINFTTLEKQQQFNQTIINYVKNHPDNR